MIQESASLVNKVCSFLKPTELTFVSVNGGWLTLNENFE